MIMADILLNMVCVPSHVQRVLHVLSHVMHTQEACEGGIVVSPNLQMGEMKYKEMWPEVKVNRLANGGLLWDPGESGSQT